MNKYREIIASAFADKNMYIIPKHNSVFETQHESSELLGDGVTNIIVDNMVTKCNKYKEEYLPRVREYVGLVNDKLNAVVDVSRLSTFTVSLLRPSELITILYESLRLSTVEVSPPDLEMAYYKFDKLEQPVNFKDASLNKMFETNNTLTDDEIQELFMLSGEDIVDYSYVNLNNMDKSVALLGILINRLGNPITDNFIRCRIRNVRTGIVRTMRHYHKMVELGVLVYDTTKNGVMCIGSVYDKFISDGYDVDVLAGHHASSDQRKTLSLGSLPEHAPKLIEAYNQINAMEELRMRGSRRTSINRAYVVSLLDLRNLDLEGGGETNISTELVKLLPRFLGESNVEDVFDTCRKILGLFVFKDDDFMTFTDDMISYNELDGELSASDTANMAMVAMVTNYFINQVDVRYG